MDDYLLYLVTSIINLSHLKTFYHRSVKTCVRMITMPFSVLGWKKGIAFLNNKNLGKYWPRVGPQMTLYMPGVWLKPPCQKNTIVLFEQEYHECGSGSPFIELTNQHVINGTTPTNSKSMKLFHKTFWISKIVQIDV